MTTPNNIINTGRVFAFIIAAVAMLGLIIRIVIAAEYYGSVVSGLSGLYQYFTLWVNTLVFILMAMVALGRRVNNTLMLSTVVSIVGVGIIFHALLSQGGAQEGWDGLANQITHTYIPVLTPFWWLMHGETGKTQWKNAFACLVTPAIYCVVTLVRAEFSGFYPYPFINLENLGLDGLIKSVIGLTIAFYVLSLAIITLAKLKQITTQSLFSATD